MTAVIQTNTPSDKELNDLIQSYQRSLRSHCTVLSGEWMPQTDKAYATLTLSCGSQRNLTTRFVQRSLYDCDYSAVIETQEEAVDAIIAIANSQSPRIRYSFEDELHVYLINFLSQDSTPNFTPRWFSSLEEFAPSESQALWAERLIKTGSELREILKGMPSGTLSERFGGQRALAKTLWLAASAKAYMP